MDRTTWLAERRAAVVAAYDAEAPTYQEYPADTQRDWVRRVLEAIPAGSEVLDAPCGTGRYFDLVAAAGHRVVGADQSAGMLEQARARGIASSLELVALQDLPFVDRFEATLTIDAMENVPPEEWPVVLARLHRAVRRGGLLYLTVEEAEQEEVDAAFRALSAQGAPAVRGEVTEGDVAGYHYYPGRDRVLAWVDAEGLSVEDEGFTQYDGWGYRHLLLRAPR